MTTAWPPNHSDLLREISAAASRRRVHWLAAVWPLGGLAFIVARFPSLRIAQALFVTAAALLVVAFVQALRALFRQADGDAVLYVLYDRPLEIETLSVARRRLRGELLDVVVVGVAGAELAVPSSDVADLRARLARVCTVARLV